MANFCSECGKSIAQGSNFCTNCGASLSGKAPANAQWQDKRQRVLGKSSNRKKVKPKTVVFVAGVILVGAWVYTNLPESGNPIIKAAPVVTNPVYYGPSGNQMVNVTANVANGKIVLPLDLVKEKRFVRFVYGDPQFGLPLLAYISSEGKIITAVSMCEPCNSTAFHLQGENIVCNSCGTTWKLNNLEAVSGSCAKYPPDPLPNTVVGNEIQIDERLVTDWRRRV